jgi:hypothetical protein
LTSVFFADPSKTRLRVNVSLVRGELEKSDGLAVILWQVAATLLVEDPQACPDVLSWFAASL